MAAGAQLLIGMIPLTLNRANAFSFLVSRTGDTDPTPSTESASSLMLDATAA